MLTANGLLDNTLLIKTADHGEMGLAHGGLRQKNFTFYEESLRVPLSTRTRCSSRGRERRMRWCRTSTSCRRWRASPARPRRAARTGRASTTRTCSTTPVPVIAAYLSELTMRLEAGLEDRLVGAWLIGSGAAGDFDRLRSDVDVQAVRATRLARTELQRLAAALSHEALPCPVRGLEFVLYAREDSPTPRTGLSAQPQHRPRNGPPRRL